MSQVVIEDVITETDIRSAGQPRKEPIVGELVGEREGS